MTTDANNSSGGFDQQDQHVDRQTNVAGNFSDNRTYNYFQATPSNLRRSFDAYMDGKLQYFVGRQFVFDALDDFIKKNPSGYFIIRAAPGMGKSSLLSKLIRDRGYIHHFNISPQNIRSARAFLENVCAQLIARYNLPQKQLPSNAGDDSGFLMECISEAAKDSKNHPIVLAVDSLDEADRTGLAPGVNSLYLPPSLPRGVFVVLTTRPLDDMHLQVSPQKQFDIEATSEINSKDIEAYTSEFIARQAKMREWLEQRKDKISREQFIAGIRMKSQGNFMYLQHVLPPIAEGRFTFGKQDILAELPDGLKGYYQRHWREMQEGKKENFEEVYAKIVCILGVAQEPVTVDQIASWTKLTSFKIKESIGEWREFLIEEESKSSKRLQIYHRSFQDFLKEQVDLTQFHDMISDYYLSRSQAAV